MDVEQEEEMNQEVPSENFLHHLALTGGRDHYSISTVPPAPATSSSSKPRDAAVSVVSVVKCNTTLDHNWQACRASIRERNAVMFNNDLMADVYFIVGISPTQRKIPAHKYILATGSSVFYAMFYGGLADGKKDIEIPDVEPSAFCNLLK